MTNNADVQANAAVTIRKDAAEASYPWMRDGSMPHTREDLIAEAVALVALVFALGIGLMIAMMPVPAQAAPSERAAAPAAAASAPSLVLAAFRIAPPSDGRTEHLEPAAKAQAGDQLEYQAVYRNPTPAALRHVIVTIPVPANGVEYVLESAAPQADLASTDGKAWSAPPLMRSDVTPDGRTVVKPAPGADYRFLRWNLGDVPAGATRAMSTRVRLLTTPLASR